MYFANKIGLVRFIDASLSVSLKQYIVEFLSKNYSETH